MTDSKLKKRQERAQAAAFDMFNTMARLGVWQCHLVIGKEAMDGEAVSGEFEGLLLAGFTEAGMDSDLDGITVTLARRPEKKMVESTTTADGVTTEEEVGDDG